MPMPTPTQPLLPVAPPPGPPQPMPPAGYGAPPLGYRPEINAGRATLLILFLAFGLAALGLLVRYITGFMDPSPGMLKVRNVGTLFFGFGTLGTSLSLLWAAYKVFEGQAVRVAAIVMGVIVFIVPFLLN
jgi:hypothetical protein